MTLRDDLAKVQTYAFLTVAADGHVTGHRVSPWHRSTHPLGYIKTPGSMMGAIAAVGASFVVRFKAYRPEYIARMDEGSVVAARDVMP